MRRRSSAAGWIVLCGGIGILTIWLWQGRGAMLPVRSGMEARGTLVERPLVPALDDAREVLMAYFQAEGVERFRFLHDRERVVPLWRDYHERRGKPVPLLIQIGKGRLATLGGRTLAFFEAEFQPGCRKPVALVWEGDRFGFDWESSVVYGSMDWIEWVETRPAAPQLMRVYMSRAGMEGLTSVEREEGWREVVAEHPDGLAPVVVRVPPGVAFPVGFTNRQRVPVMAEFRFAGSRIELVRFHHEGWSR